MVWSHVHDLTGRELRTLARCKRFVVEHVNDRQAHLFLRETGKSRLVKREEIEGAWEHLGRECKLTAKEMLAKYALRTSAHVAAILASMPQVKYVKKPVITLYLRQQP